MPTKIDKLFRQYIVKDTAKMYYGKYLYRAELEIDAIFYSRYVNAKTGLEKLKGIIDSRKRAIRKRQDGSYLGMLDKSVLNANADLIYNTTMHLKTIKGLRFRVEHNTIGIFAETEEILLNALTPNLRGFVKTIHRPVNPNAKLMLEDNVIFHPDPQYKFKVFIKTKKYGSSLGKQILNYASNYEKDIHISDSLTGKLAMERSMPISGYFYANSTEPLLFLKMISPDFVNKIYRLELPPNK